MYAQVPVVYFKINIKNQILKGRNKLLLRLRDRAVKCYIDKRHGIKGKMILLIAIVKVNRNFIKRKPSFNLRMERNVPETPEMKML